MIRLLFGHELPRSKKKRAELRAFFFLFLTFASGPTEKSIYLKNEKKKVFVLASMSNRTRRETSVSMRADCLCKRDYQDLPLKKL
ncbi:hypothetical protein OPV22_017099 [Ensete ventricosum]|uniref:Secreted protein n=1 Tax=Ensete ventricosum TaxID=4639 RepID=A0AAV8QMK4_ENSVE|nr:hypothetical protein OPV22_017099 [Ensete ventricosum]